MGEVLYIEGSGDECDARIDTWLKDLLPRTPGLVRKIAQRELLLAIREFYNRSAAWRVVIGPKNVVANKSRYNLSPYDAYANISRVFWVATGTSQLAPLSSRPAGTTLTGTPYAFYNDSPDSIVLWPTPILAVPSSLTISVALVPKISVNHLPRIAATDHYDAILDGALGRILMHPAKPYSNLVLAKYHLSRFRAAIAGFKGEAIQGHNGAQTWAFPSFGK